MDRDTFLAHITEDGRVQPAQTHCRNTAQYASDAMKVIGLPHTGYLAGLLHDAGKFKAEFNEYLLDSVIRHKPVKRGSVNHTFAGARYALENWHGSGELGYAEITAELLAFSIGSHHGLFDCVDEKRHSGFLYRQEKHGIGYEESMENFLAQCANRAELDGLFRESVMELTPILEKLSGIPQCQDDESANSEIFFYMGLLGRMLLSAVIEGDRRDTAEFLLQNEFPAYPKDMRAIWADCLERMERKLENLPSRDPIDRARRFISDTCAASARHPGGVFRLNVPTGGGKTLSGLRYALTHGRQWNKSRIVFTSPLLSILEQNARVIRDYIGDDSLILEHHSNLVEPKETEEQLNRLELLMESWESPVIITTLVQLLNTIFSGKTSSIRRFHALCGSIIVIDEVQTVPNKMLTLFNLAVNFLAEVCDATVVLCSATQPCLEAASHPLLSVPVDIVPRQKELWQVFRRTEIQDGGCSSLEELPAVIEDSLQKVGSILVVCNKKDQAAFLFHALSGAEGGHFHLSAAMCVAHRREVRQALQTALDNSRNGGPKVICVSTQVIEAGVNISFQRVIRFAAGMDSVVQSAGRCNRNAECDTPGEVSVLQCLGENLRYLSDIREGQGATVALLDAYKKAPERFENDLSGDEAIGFYYHQLYNRMDKGFQDDQVGEHGSIFDLLADNQKYADANCTQADTYFIRQAFKLAGDLFQVFDQNTTDVLVPYGHGKVLREELIQSTKAFGSRDYDRERELLKQAKLYTVSVYQYQREKLQQQGALIPLLDGSAYALTDGYYDPETGFSLKKGSEDFWEV